jgi:anti-sigma factor RsiW
MPPDSHDEFLELCALSTTGELTGEEWERLREHLATCEACREAKQQYERVVATTIPALAVESGPVREEEARGEWSIEKAEADLMDALRAEPSPSEEPRKSKPSSIPWKHPRILSVAALLLASCSLAAFQLGMHHGHGPDMAVAPVVSPQPKAPARVVPSPVANTALPEKKGIPEDGQSVALRNQLRLDQLEVAALKARQTDLESELTKRSADLDQSVRDRAELNRQLSLAQASAQTLQAKLDQIGGQNSQEAAQALTVKTQVNDLTAALQAKDREIAQEQELLQHDRDIRNLIGARDLYIAEIYDVAKSGETQKPFGRVFYTKDKSLIFYGYDLDQQKGVRQASTFQAWGRRGTDQQHDVSLGLLYQDDTNQKRWVLKFNDPKTIAQIDAVFITVEPRGGSTKPSGKPLLFAYLRLDPNHP